MNLNGGFSAAGRRITTGGVATTLVAQLLVFTGLFSPIFNGLFSGNLSADTIVLDHGGTLQGQVVTPGRGEQPYVIQVAGGSRLEIPTERVKRVIAAGEHAAEYARRSLELADTAEAHWELAEWCRERGLSSERQAHLQQVIRWVPDHEPARAALGFVYRGGRWVAPDDWMASQGFVRFRGSWRLPLDVAMVQAAEQRELQIKRWRQVIRRGVEGRSAPGQALDWTAQLVQSNDPLIVDAVSAEFLIRKNPAERLLLVNLLGSVGTGAAHRVLVQAAIFDTNGDVRDQATDWLSRNRPLELVPLITTALRHKDNGVINRAANLLGVLEDPTAVPALIPALTTVHRVALPSSSGMQAGFSRGADGSPGGTGFSAGERPKFKDQPVNNRQVLSALQKLTGVDFDFAQPAWWQWYVASTTPTKVNLRRSL